MCMSSNCLAFDCLVMALPSFFIGLFVEDAINVLRKELAWESDYVREAECATKFR